MRPRPATTRVPRSMWAGVLLAVFALLVAVAPPAASADRQPVIAGGDVIYSQAGGRCVVGFNAQKGEQPYGIILGRCAGAVGTTWYADATRKIPIGTTAVATFPRADYGLVQYTNPDVSYPGKIRPGTGSAIDIVGAEQPVAGHAMCQVGQRVGYQCGTVRAVNVSVTVPGGTLTGLFTSSACSEAEDAGGPAFTSNKALGIIVGQTGGCRHGGTTYYQPILPVLAAHSLTLR